MQPALLEGLSFSAWPLLSIIMALLFFAAAVETWGDESNVFTFVVVASVDMLLRLASTFCFEVSKTGI